MPMSARPEDRLLVGDSPDDVEAGYRAGVKTWAATCGYGKHDELAVFTPDYCVDLRELSVAQKSPIEHFYRVV
jgi:phosphoglycolate phosphatase-like HAD superfamily hydrolase